MPKIKIPGDYKEKMGGIWPKLAKDGYVVVDPKLIAPGNNYRRYEESDLEGLVNSIKRTKGVVQSITITNNKDEKTMKEQPYVVVAGHRRHEASIIAELDIRSMYFKDLTQEEILRIQLSENLKKHIPPAELASTASSFYFEVLSQKLNLDYEELKNKYLSPNNLPNELRKELTIKDFSEIIGKDSSTISNYFKFSNLAPQLRKSVLCKNFGYGKAILLAGLEEDEQLRIAQHFKGSKKRLIKRLNKDEELKLILEGPNNNPSSNIATYLLQLEKLTFAARDYFLQKKVISLSLEKEVMVKEAYNFLANIKGRIEERAKGSGLLEKLKACSHGKKSIRDFVIKDYFNSNFDEDPGELTFFETDKLIIDLENTRKTYSGINELADNLEREGQVVPLLVSPIETEHCLVVDGNRRTKGLKKKEIPYAAVIIKKMSKKQIRMAQFEAELHEEDSPMEKAKAIFDWNKLAELRGEDEQSRKETASSLGINIKIVENAFNFISASNSVKSLYTRGLISYGATCEIGTISKKKDQRELAYRSYLLGGSINVTRGIIREYQKSLRQESLFSDIKVDFTHALSKPFSEYLDSRALERLNKLNIKNPSQVHRFYNIFNNLEKLNAKLSGSYST